jgi:NADPH-dependent ferric siderophore reductase
MNSAVRSIRRVRHEVKQRRLTVEQASSVTPKMRRITLAGADLEGFTSLGFDDHIKLFFPSGSAAADERPPMRDYTPRFDAGTGRLYIDFAIHDAGPATVWATTARPGDELLIGGPRGSAIIPTDFDWHLLIGDETALPAIGRRLEELPSGSRAMVIVEITDELEQQSFVTQADLSIHWVYRRALAAGSSDGLVAALRAMRPLAGDFFAWAAAETNVARAVRRVLIDEHRANPDWVKAAGYWKRGSVAVHDTIND